MNEKITMQDIIEQVAKKHGMSRKDAETFVRGMFELIEEALDTENYVKIKGLGTFKLTEVDSRESVNVNTGERIEIQGHTKITFTPDTTMKDQINKPFAHFETVILNEGTSTEDMEAEVLNVKEMLIEDEVKKEIVLPTEEEMPSEEPKPVQMEEVAIEEEQPVIEEKEIGAFVEEIVEEQSISEVAEEVIVSVTEEEQTVDEASSELEPIAEEQEEIVEGAKEEVSVAITPVEEEQTEEEEKRQTPWGIIIAIILVLCLASGIYWYMHSTPEEPVVPTTLMEVPKEEAPVVQPQDTLVQEVKTDSLIANESKRDSSASVKSEVPKAVLNDTIEYEITGTKTTLVLQPGETLVKLALRFYGTKGLWNYIVEYNKDVITDADVVPVGTTLRIPELSPKK